MKLADCKASSARVTNADESGHLVISSLMLGIATFAIANQYPKGPPPTSRHVSRHGFQSLLSPTTSSTLIGREPYRNGVSAARNLLETVRVASKC
jgi:hypothetical protein